MRNTDTYTEDDYEVYGGELVESIPARRSLSTMLASRAGNLMLQDAMLQAANDHCRAMLAQAALEHTGALAVMTSRLSSIAPQGREYYEEVLRAYATKAASSVKGW